MDTIRNKVSESGIVSIDPESWISELIFKTVDLKDILFQGMILREKDLRDFIAAHVWEDYTNCVTCITCSTDAIVPQWAWMLLAGALQPHAKSVHCCDPSVLAEKALLDYISSMDAEQYANKRVVVKGCSAINPGPEVYVQLSAKLLPVVKSLMYGEPCSSVPVFKKAKTN